MEAKKECEFHLVLTPQDADILVDALVNIDPSRQKNMKVIQQIIDALKLCSKRNKKAEEQGG